MNKLRTTIRERFYKTKQDKIADMVEEIEDAMEKLKSIPVQCEWDIENIEKAIEREDKKEVDRLYKELKKWDKVMKSDEFHALVNSQEGIQDLIDKTFKTK